MPCSPIRSRRASSPSSWDVRVDNERPGPRSCEVLSLAPDLAHGAVAGLLGEGETGCWLYARRLPKNVVDRRNRVFRADGVLYGNVEVPQLLRGAVQDLTPGDEERAEARAVGVAVQGHQFYEPDVHGIPQRKLRHVCDLIVVHAAHCDGVDLDRRKGRLERRHHRLPDLLEVVAPRYEGELLGLEGIEGDVDTVEASFDEAIQVLLE